ncbi:MAG: EF-Tu/IF-2/RF-3 family GTPase [Candidatus Hydrothermarchaeota archaeon]
MRSLNIGIFNDPELPKTLGKKGTASDIAIYNRKVGEEVYTFAAPVGYPEKLAPLFQTIGLSDCAILCVKELTPALGEVVLALDAFGLEGGLLVLDGIDQTKAAAALKGTVAAGYKTVGKDYNAIMEGLKGMEPRKGGALKIPVDHSFDVRGVGTVVLGVVRGGKIRVHDELLLLPSGKEIVVKSIQMQDEAVEEASSGDRVGLALKGATVEELRRGAILAARETGVKSSRDLVLELRPNPYFKEPLKVGQKVLLGVGLQYEPAQVVAVEGGGTLEVRLRAEREILYEAGERAALARPEVKGLRVVGGGILR